MTKLKLRLFEPDQSMSKWPAGSVYIGSIIYYLIYLPTLFPKGLEVNLEESSLLPIFMLLMHINRLGLVIYMDDYSAVLLYVRVSRLVLQPSI